MITIKTANPTKKIDYIKVSGVMPLMFFMLITNEKERNVMKHLRIVFTAALLFLVYTTTTHSQISLSIGPSVGYIGPQSDYSGTTVDYYNGTKYGLGSGVNFGAIARVRIPFLSGKLGLSYASLSASGDPGQGGGTIDVKQKLLVISIGPEFNIAIPFSPVVPYLGLDLLFTTISGETTFNGVARVPSGTYEMSSATRTGLGLGAGVIVGFGKKFSLDAGLKFNLHNLFGKTFTGGSDERLSSYTSLNDDADPLNSSDPDDHPIAQSRNISTIQFNLAFLFDF